MKASTLRTFQIVQPFRDVNVMENVVAAVVGPGHASSGAHVRARAVLERVKLDHRAHVLARHLSLPDRTSPRIHPYGPQREHPERRPRNGI